MSSEREEEGRIIVVTSNTSSDREVEVEGMGTLYNAGGLVVAAEGLVVLREEQG